MMMSCNFVYIPIKIKRVEKVERRFEDLFFPQRIFLFFRFSVPPFPDNNYKRHIILYFEKPSSLADNN